MHIRNRLTRVRTYNAAVRCLRRNFDNRANVDSVSSLWLLFAIVTRPFEIVIVFTRLVRDASFLREGCRGKERCSRQGWNRKKKGGRPSSPITRAVCQKTGAKTIGEWTVRNTSQLSGIGRVVNGCTPKSPSGGNEMRAFRRLPRENCIVTATCLLFGVSKLHRRRRRRRLSPE